MIVFCLGMPGSASTLAFNLAREVVEAATGEPATGLEATTLGALEQGLAGPPPRAVVIRAHTASAAMLALLGAAGTRAVLTARDPRDCVASLCARLGGEAVHWCTEVARSLAAVATVQARWGLPAIGFEEGGQDVPALLEAIRARVGLPLSAPDAAAIAARWSRAAVAQRVGALAEAAEPSIFGWRSDPATGLNESHLGDGRIGKWRDALSAADAQRVDQAFAGVGDAALPARPGRRLVFAEPLVGTAARPAPVGNLAPHSPLGLRLLCLCFLGIGRWRVTLRGSLPASHAPGWLRVAVGGEVWLTLPLPAAAPGESQVPMPEAASVVLDHQVHEQQMEVLLDGPAGALPDPFRPDALRLEAEFLRA